MEGLERSGPRNTLDIIFDKNISHKGETISVKCSEVTSSIQMKDIFRLSILDDALKRGWKVQMKEADQYEFTRCVSQKRSLNWSRFKKGITFPKFKRSHKSNKSVDQTIDITLS